MEGPDPEDIPREAASEAAIRIFELRTGSEFVAFFADTAADLPDDRVRRELRAVSNRYGAITRSTAGTIANDIVVGLVSGGISAYLAAYLPATTKWLNRRPAEPAPDDVAMVLAKIRATAMQLLGTTPGNLSDAAIEQGPDGQWQATFRHRDLQIAATLAPAGTVVGWRQTTLPDAARRPARADEPPAESQGHAFLSAAAEDGADADRLQRDLEVAGIRVWRDASNLFPGDDQPTAIRQAITDGALVFLACFSSRSIALVRSHLNAQLLLAIDELRQRRPDRPWLIPIRFDDCAVPAIELGGGRNLARLTSADLFGEHRDGQTERLLTAIARIFGHHPQEQAADLAGAPASIRPDGPS